MKKFTRERVTKISKIGSHWRIDRKIFTTKTTGIEIELNDRLGAKGVTNKCTKCI